MTNSELTDIVKQEALSLGASLCGICIKVCPCGRTQGKITHENT